MVCTFVITIVYLNLKSMCNILNAITTKYRILANKSTKFWKLSLVIFLRFWPAEPHFLITFFLIKKKCYIGNNWKDPNSHVAVRKFIIAVQNSGSSVNALWKARAIQKNFWGGAEPLKMNNNFDKGRSSPTLEPPRNRPCLYCYIE